ncbi:RluA family pseudouridine synthase [Aquabacterium sp. A7-Y]|uniref:RluA family pseudouridine synthase n=1 Tax=Aquabacterium sp. A7-Y TaxID=1349605 RepID=UPI00223DFDE7|nr:RluA family pseudouridine synthase [Aquabacterium sp. A7-Y]MCW7540347.1 RluA family pseudouridine synthase [Aquabacterium sp. A7-Y]
MLPPSRSEPSPSELVDPEDEAPEAAEAERRETVVDAARHGLRLDKLLVELAGEFSRSHLQSLIEQGCVLLDGRLADTASRKVHVGQRVQVELRPTPQSQAFRPEPLGLDIVFEDAHLMVVRKPAGLVVHPAAGHWSGTLLNGLLAHHPGAAALPRAGIVHRLDKDTSGLMVVGKTLESVTALVRAIAAREVRREYAALVHGEILQPARLASIEAPIGRDPQSRVRMAVLGSGKPARTEVALVATALACSAVRCRLHTGRTHQIRVHLASRGFPLVGDTLYGGRPALGLQRQALHAARLGLQHPVSGEPLSFEAAPPEDFAAAWREVAGSVDLMC